MRLTPTFASLGSILVLLTGHAIADATSTPCPHPKPDLRVGEPNSTTIGQPILFTFRNQSYPMDIYSAYAPQATGPDSSICLRYEAVNKSADPIEMFFWPVASGYQSSKKIDSQQRIRILTAVPSGASPSAKESWLYAFLNSIAKGKAYQQQSSATDVAFTRLASTELQGVIHQAQAFSPSQKKTFKDPASLANIGTQFSTSQDQVGSFSTAAWDGKNFMIKISITRSNEKFAPKIAAPFAYALFKSSSAAGLLGLMRELRNVTLPMQGETFNVSSSFPLEFNEPALYVIQQPITIHHPDSSVCFLAPTYSPIPIPSNFLECDVTRG